MQAGDSQLPEPHHRGAAEPLVPLLGLIAVALAAPVFAVGFDAVRQAWTAIYVDGALLRAFCL